MSNADRSILVAGATGRQGGGVARHLKARGWRVKALSRTPEGVTAGRLRAEGIEVVRGDMADPSSLARAMEGCYGVFSVQNYFEYGGEKEVQNGVNMADAAKQSGVAHFLFSSVAGAGADSPVPHFKSKHRVEEYVRNAGLNATILRPVKFMENYYILQVYKAILGGNLIDAIAREKRHQMIAVDDVGAYAADAFEHPADYAGDPVEIAGDSLTNAEIARAMSEVLGRRVKSRTMPLFAAGVLMNKEVYLMYRWFNEVGFSADIEGNRKKFSRVRPMTLKEWLIGEHWDRWNKKGSL